VGIALTGCAAAAAAFVLVLGSDHGSAPEAHAGLVAWITLSYILCGLVAWWQRPESRFGPLMVAAGFAPFLSTLSVASAEVPRTIGQVLILLPPVLFLHVFLAYPSGRLEGRLERWLVAAAYVAAVGLSLVRMLVGGVGAHNMLEAVSQPGAAESVRQAQVVVVSALLLTGTGILIRRRRSAGRPLRRTRGLLVGSYALALLLIALGVVASNFGVGVAEEIRVVTFGMIAVSPAVLLLGLLRARLARSTVGDLLVELDEDPGPADLRDALARALRDPSLTLAYWLPQFRSWADLEGRVVTLPADGDARATTLIERGGVRVAALLHDRALDQEPKLLDAVTAAAGIALENGRLQVELRARLAELTGSRARIVDAGQRERQRLERNLHDGAQQRLIALSLELSLLGEQMETDRDARLRLDHARREIATTLDELRDVARGIHPAVVTGHGLEIALEQLAARAPVPVRLEVALGGRLPERLEVAAFYLVSESLANIGKHASASSATVDVDLVDGVVVVEVVDDGIGGADTERGSGLRGLADRVEALEGRLRVWSPSGGGTRLRAEIPCVR
jgi:signal transduction histidine kinase